MDNQDPTTRFSDRADDYSRSRPGYPHAMIAWLRECHGLAPSQSVADIGAGTGISSKLFLDNGNRVIAVEPNDAMRAHAISLLGDFPRFSAVPGRAEATGLADGSVDIVSAAQAFHWFDPAAARREWARILRKGGLAVIYWNTRLTTGSAFQEGLEAVLHTHATGYVSVTGRYADETAMRHWYGSGFRAVATFDNPQRFDLPGLRTRVLSSSYAPHPGQPGHDALMNALARLFEATATVGQVTIHHKTHIYVGTL